MKSTEESNTTICECCGGRPTNGFIKDFREMRDGSLRKMWVCEVCANLDDYDFWGKREKYLRIRSPLKAARAGYIRRRYNPWRKMRRRIV